MTRHNEWRKMQIILERDLVSKLYDWHGGQWSALYSLASTADRNLVSLSMIDAALDELRSTLGHKPRKDWKGWSKKERKELNDVINDLSSTRLYWHESSAKEAGMLVGENPETFYNYDRADRGMDAAEEAGMVEHGEWANPRKAMKGVR